MEMHFTLSSPAFEGGQRIPAEYTCEGNNRPPPLEWSHVPEDARSFALIVEDPDARNGTFTHWLQWDIPGDARSLDGAARGIPGTNDFQGLGYGGPCPPPNHGAHRYLFHLYALDVASLDLREGARRDQLEAAIEGHILAEDLLMGRFER